jgi:hypothetical protein
MNCPDCDREIHGTACVCGWMKKGSPQSPMAYWLTAHCATEGCNTTIRWPYNKPKGLDVCKWCQEKENEQGQGVA